MSAGRVNGKAKPAPAPGRPPHARMTVLGGSQSKAWMCKTRMHFATLFVRQICHQHPSQRHRCNKTLTIACATSSDGNLLFHPATGTEPAATVTNLENPSAGFQLQLTSKEFL
jgi:hypothetical protein